MRFQILQHVPYEGPGIIADWAAVHGHEVRVTKFYEEGCRLPDAGEFDCLVVMGGPMRVGDEAAHPWLVEEKRAIEAAIGSERAVLGICLGAQLVASVLGARIRRNQHTEIGWAPIWLTEEGAETEYFADIREELEVFHWHSDTFEIPEGAINVAQSAGCRHQAFLYGDNVLGLQFHLEVTRKDVMAMIEETDEDLAASRFVQTPAKILGRENPFRRINHAMRGILMQLANESVGA